ncbi:4-methyl-5(b-hydroxyethyl)-thiazole monophosphate biosynthesis protein [Spiroplasma sp. TIUS-1]|uniref:DJ-1/PfpI family protein n=1 Tax=Spiroplasma sp. TIUS-1 TaxID=216963 RepID=UPI00139960F3|nr:DJ-1/PfpI family protein [Spiroplasma sp. TIUS-1]QHX35960.1 4-methyl-5(b-hydroxyethyl)-thiazole monophosphate biosynthesis protein [Spiroplasma sp. TIUS-1]
MKRLAIFLYDSFEDTEAVGTIDVIRRGAKMFPNHILGIDVISIQNKDVVTGSWNNKLVVDKHLSDINFEDYDGLILPGGPAVVELLKSNPLEHEFKKAYDNNKLIAAICAAPQLLGKWGMLDNIKVVNYPGTDKFLNESILQNKSGSIRDGNIITGSSIGGTIDFALNIVEYFVGESKINELKKILFI